MTSTSARLTTRILQSGFISFVDASKGSSFQMLEIRLTNSVQEQSSLLALGITI
jgi:hypothetical protein